MQQEQSFRNLMTHNPGVLVSVGYLVISLIGMLFSQSLFSQFGVNYFNYAEVSDFLLAALREPMTFVLAGGAIIVVSGIFVLSRMENRWLTKRAPTTRLGKLYQQTSAWTHNNSVVMFLAFVLYSYLFLNLYGGWKSDQIKRGVGRQVTVELSSEPGGIGDQRHFEDIMLLGTSNKFVFVYDIETKSVDIIPIESMARLIVRQNDELSPATPEPAPQEPGNKNTAETNSAAN